MMEVYRIMLVIKTDFSQSGTLKKFGMSNHHSMNDRNGKPMHLRGISSKKADLNVRCLFESHQPNQHICKGIDISQYIPNI